MEAKNFIREYEKLKNEKVGDILEKQKLELKWLKLYKDMNFALKKLSKKQKTELNTFKEKTLKEFKSFSKEIYIEVTAKKDFNEVLKRYENIYFKQGSKALIEMNLKNDFDKPSSFFEEVKNLKNKDEIGKEEWLNKIKELESKNLNNLFDAFALEEDYLKIFSWYYKNSSKPIMEKLIQDNFNKLSKEYMYLINYILNELGYKHSFEHYFPSKSDKKTIKKIGFLKMFEESKNRNNQRLTDEIEKNINVIHPRELFKNVRGMKRHFHLHLGPTNSGKTYNAIERLTESEKGIYLSPIRLLALEIKDKLTEKGVPCDLITGDEKLYSKGAKHKSTIVEITPFKENFEVAVIDEIQMISDNTRGSYWLNAVYGIMAKEIHLCGSDISLEFITKIIEDCGDTYEVHNYQRQTQLVLEDEKFIFPYSTRKGDALVVFSKNKVLENQKILTEKGYKVSIMYGNLPPETRKKQMEMFISGETDVIITTDAIGIGLNLPIERIVFLESEKFDGFQRRKLNTQEIKQIAGRAGRRGIHEKGYVNALKDKEYIFENVYKNEESIKNSYMNIDKEFVNSTTGTLYQKYLVWNSKNFGFSDIKKQSLKDVLILLKRIEKIKYSLNKEQLEKILKITFDIKNKEILNLWYDYVIELSEGKEELKKPVKKGNDLNSLETYYHKLNLYYQFSNKFNLKIYSGWLKNEKYIISNQINKTL